MFRLYLLTPLLACSHSSNVGSADATISDAASTDDGSATRQQCTSKFGTQLSADATFGRLDGFLVSIVPPSGMQSCNDDESHVHLQIRMNAEIYDIAIDVTDDQTGSDDVHTLAMDIAQPDTTAWTEGWHTGVLADYVALGVHSTDLPFEAKADMVSILQTDLASANHVSVYTTSYGPDGGHLVHRNGSGHDGLLVTNPLANPSHIRFFAFTDQAF